MNPQGLERGESGDLVDVVPRGQQRAIDIEKPEQPEGIVRRPGLGAARLAVRLGPAVVRHHVVLLEISVAWFGSIGFLSAFVELITAQIPDLRGDRWLDSMY